MMSSSFQMILIGATGFSLIFTSVMIIRKQMRIKYSLAWFLLNLVLVVFAVFPGIVKRLAELMHIYSDTNTIFLIMIFILYCLCFGFSIALSRNSNRIADLTQQMGILQAEIDSLMGRENRQNKAS